MANPIIEAFEKYQHDCRKAHRRFLKAVNKNLRPGQAVWLNWGRRINEYRIISLPGHDWEMDVWLENVKTGGRIKADPKLLLKEKPAHCK